MDESTQRALVALADGSLEPGAREALLRRAEESPELADTLSRQRAALTAIRATEAEVASDALQARVAAILAAAGGAVGAPGDRAAGLAGDRAGLAGDRFPRTAAGRAVGARRARRPRPRVFAVGTGVAVLAAVAVVLFTGGAEGPSVAAAAQVALAPSRAAAPRESPGGRTLDASVDGVAYPSWEDTTGWRAVGSRRDTLHGRSIRTVFYANRGGKRIGYAIAAGSPLRSEGGTTVEKDGVSYRVLRSGGAVVVTWLRGGHSCILAARGVDADVLVDLATWS
jgi:hypothetical protein